MASAPTVPVIAIEDYLNSGYHPDVEYVQGLLVERSVPTLAHSLLQALLVMYFGNLRKQFGFAVATECRVEIVEQSRYRIPDVLLAALPVTVSNQPLKTVPLAVIEIWSPTDRMPQQMARFREYWNRGVRQIVILDPEGCAAFRYDDGALIETEFQQIALPDGQKIPFSSTGIFDELKQEIAR